MQTAQRGIVARILLILSSFFFINAQTIDQNTYYRLSTQWQGEGKSLDVSGKTVFLNRTNQSSSQLWRITSTGNGYYRLTNKQYGNGSSIDLYQDGSSFKPQLVQTGNYSGQYWKVTSLGSGYFRLTSMWQGEAKSLDVINDGTNNKLWLSQTGAYSGQYWKLTPDNGTQNYAQQQTQQHLTAAQQEAQRQAQIKRDYNRNFQRASFPNYLYSNWNDQNRQYSYTFRENFIEWRGNKYNMFDVAYSPSAGLYRVVTKYYTDRIHQDQSYLFFIRVYNQNQIAIQRSGAYWNYEAAFMQMPGNMEMMYKAQNYNNASIPRPANSTPQQQQNIGRKAAAATGAAIIGGATVVKKAAETTGQAYQQAGKQVVKTAKPVVKQTGKTIVKGTKKAGKAVKNTAKKAGKAIGNLFKKKKKKKKN